MERVPWTWTSSDLPVPSTASTKRRLSLRASTDHLRKKQSQRSSGLQSEEGDCFNRQAGSTTTIYTAFNNFGVFEKRQQLLLLNYFLANKNHHRQH
mmetsp:Transcript_24237/g.51492  ORF Transcript_24237/g.51492 Transcript_24237/m.51492 type:complete len:96 (+) Transcript_24237:148-435(+)